MYMCAAIYISKIIKPGQKNVREDSKTHRQKVDTYKDTRINKDMDRPKRRSFEAFHLQSSANDHDSFGLSGRVFCLLCAFFSQSFCLLKNKYV